MDRGANDLSLQVALSFVDRGASAGLRGFGSTFAGLAGPLGLASVGMAAFGTISVAAIAKSVQLAAQYQQQMLMVQSLTGSSQAQMAQYSDGLKALAIESGVAPTKLASGLYYVISAGYHGADAMNMLSLATKDAVIGMTDSKVTANALTTVMQGFNEKTSDMTKVNGEMLRTVTLGKMSMQDYAGAVSKVAVLHAQYGVTLEDTNATLATLTSSGYKSAAIAATGYSALVSIMDGKTDLMTKRIHKLGLGFDETKFKQMDYQHQLACLNEVMKGHYDQLQNVLGGSKQAASAFTTLETHSQMFTSNLKALSDQQKNAMATQQAWAITQGGLSQTMNRLSAALTVLGIDVGNVFLPILTRLAAAAIPVVVALANWVLQLSLLSTLLINRLVPALTPFERILTLVSFTFDRELKQATKRVYDEMYMLWGLLVNNGMLNDSFKATSTWMVTTGVPVYTQFANVVGETLGGAYEHLQQVASKTLSFVGNINARIQTQLSGIKFPALTVPSLKTGGLPGLPGLPKLPDFSGTLLPIQHFVQQVQNILGGIGQFFHNLFQPFIDEWNRVATALMPSFMQFAAWWQTTMVPLFAQFSVSVGGAKSPLKEILDIFGNVVILVIKIAMVLIEFLLPAVVRVVGIFLLGVGAVLSLLKPLLDFWLNFTGWLSTTGVAIIRWVFDMLSLSVTGWKRLLEGLANWFTTKLWPVISLLFSDIGQGWDWVTSHLKDGIDKLKGFFQGFAQFVSGVWSGIFSFLTSGFNAIIGQVNGVIQAVDKINITTPFGHIGFNIPLIPLITSRATGVGGSIPSFAGGVENFSGGLAYVHKDELLVNMPAGTGVKRAGSFGGGGGGHTYVQNNTITISVSGRPSRHDLEGMADDLDKILSKKWRGNANIQIATSGSVRS